MPGGDKSSYTDDQKRQAEHIEKGSEHRDVSKKDAKRRTWAMVDKLSGSGGKVFGTAKRLAAQRPVWKPRG
jgi:hypothetical protein